MSDPYFTEEHEMFRKTVRDFVEKEITPHADEREELARGRTAGVALAVMVQTDMATPPIAMIDPHLFNSLADALT